MDERGRGQCALLVRGGWGGRARLYSNSTCRLRVCCKAAGASLGGWESLFVRDGGVLCWIYFQCYGVFFLRIGILGWISVVGVVDLVLNGLVVQTILITWP